MFNIISKITKSLLKKYCPWRYLISILKVRFIHIHFVVCGLLFCMAVTFQNSRELYRMIQYMLFFQIIKIYLMIISLQAHRQHCQRQVSNQTFL